jgi:hypothetical protein
MMTRGLDRRDSGGAALMLCIVLIAVVGIFVSVFHTNVCRAISARGRAVKADMALAIAEAGIEKSLWALERGRAYDGETETVLGEGVFSTTVTRLEDDTWRIESRGSIPNATEPYGEATVRVVARVDADRERAEIVAWEEKKMVRSKGGGKGAS